jgi:hypothetical protein
MQSYAPANELWAQPTVILKDDNVIAPNYIDDDTWLGGQGVNFAGNVSFNAFIPATGTGHSMRVSDTVELRAVELSLTLTNETGGPTTWRVISGVYNENNTTATSSGFISDLSDNYASVVCAPNAPIGFKAVRSKKYTIFSDDVVDVPVVSAGVFSQKTLRKKINLAGKKCLCQFITGVTTGTGMPFVYLINDSTNILASAPSVTGLIRYHYVCA